jgi:hypothetical protein
MQSRSRIVLIPSYLPALPDCSVFSLATTLRPKAINPRVSDMRKAAVLLEANVGSHCIYHLSCSERIH